MNKRPPKRKSIIGQVPFFSAILLAIIMLISSCSADESDQVMTTYAAASDSSNNGPDPVGPHPDPIPKIASIRTEIGREQLDPILVVGIPGTVKGGGKVFITNLTQANQYIIPANQYITQTNQYIIAQANHSNWGDQTELSNELSNESTTWEVEASEAGSFAVTILAKGNDVLAVSYQKSEPAFFTIPKHSSTSPMPLPPVDLIEPIPTIPLVIRSALSPEMILIRGILNISSSSSTIPGIMVINLDNGQVNAVQTSDELMFQVEIPAAPNDHIFIYEDVHPLWRSFGLKAP